MPLYAGRPTAQECFIWDGTNFSEMESWYTARGGYWTLVQEEDGSLTAGIDFGPGGNYTRTVPLGAMLVLYGSVTENGLVYFQEVGPGPTYSYNITEA